MDILLAGQYMPVNLLLNNKGTFNHSAQHIVLPKTEGLWNCIEQSDLDKDGDPDFVLGNLGHNNFFQDGLRIFVHDFDDNGTMEQICSQYMNEGHFPIHDIDEMYAQMPILRKAFRTYGEFAKASLEEIGFGRGP